MNLDYALTSHIIYAQLNNNTAYNHTTIFTPHKILFHLEALLWKVASLILFSFSQITWRI